MLNFNYIFYKLKFMHKYNIIQVNNFDKMLLLLVLS